MKQFVASIIVTCLERAKTFYPTLKFSEAHLKSKHLLLNVLPHLVMIGMVVTVVIKIAMMINLLLLLDHPLHLLFTNLSDSVAIRTKEI